MKKNLVKLLILSLLSFALLSISATVKTEAASCQHPKQITVTTNATCGENGKKEVICASCRYVFSTTVIKATGKHSYGSVYAIKAAGCETYGSGYKTCNTCGHRVDVTISPLGHSTSEVYNAPTCTSSGERYFYCSRCKQRIGNTVKYDKTGHSFGTKVYEDTASTCTQKGKGYKLCSTCGTKNWVELGLKAHNPVAFSVPATCTSEGKQGTKCSVCDTIIGNATTIKKKDHTLGDLTIVKDATCTDYGSGYRICSVCKNKIGETIKPKGHNGRAFSEDSTCAKEGKEGSKCMRCGAILGECTPIAKKPHTWGAWVIDHARTATEWGEKHRTCNVCGEIDVLKIEPGDDTGNGNKTDDPVDNGHSGGTGNTGGTGDTGNNDACAKGHTWGTWIDDKAAKCEEMGSRHRKCNVCQKIEYETTPMKGHKSETFHHVASCKDEYYVSRCSVCLKELDKREYVPFEHQNHYNLITTIETEKIDAGSFIRVWQYSVSFCSYCSKEVSRTLIDVKDLPGSDFPDFSDLSDGTDKQNTCKHDWGTWICDHKETETQYGQYHRICSKCSKTEVMKKDPVKSEKEQKEDKQKNCKHQWGTWICDHKETTKDYGSYHRVCPLCGLIDYKQEPPRIEACLNGHDFSGGWTIDRVANCATSGYKWRRCLRNGCTAIQEEVTSINPNNHSAFSTHIQYRTERGSLVPFGIRLAGEYTIVYNQTVCDGCGKVLKEEVNQEVLEQYRNEINSIAEAFAETFKDKKDDTGKTDTGKTDTGKNDTGKTDPGKSSNNVCQNGHSWGQWVTRSVGTCKSTGLKERTCQIPGCNAVEQITLEMVDHQYSQVKVPTTCKEIGYTAERCVFCGKERNKKTDKALADHTYGTWICDHKENCVQKGSYHRICEVCKKTDYKKVSESGHVGKSKPKTVKSTCSKQGYTVNVCKNCGCELGSRSYLPFAEHVYSRKVVVSPTCNTTGYAVYECENCEKKVGRVTLAKLNHNVESWTVERQADYKNEGVEKGECILCHQVFRRPIAKLVKNDADSFKAAGFSIAPYFKDEVLFDQDGYCLSGFSEYLYLNVYSNVDWELNTGSSYAHIYIGEKDCGSTFKHTGSSSLFISIRLDPMKTKLERDCTAVFTYMDKGKQATTSIKLKQRRDESTISSSKAEYVFDKNGKCINISGKESAAINIKSAVGWKVTAKSGSSNASWVRITEGSSTYTKNFSGEGSSKLSIGVSPTNEYGQQRVANITVKCDGGEEFNVSIIQQLDHVHDYEEKKASNGGIKKRCKEATCPENEWKTYYKLTFDLDGGKCPGLEKEVMVLSKDGGNYKMPYQQPTKKGFDFVGWMPDGNTNIMLYPGDGFSICAKHSFKAVWGCKNPVRVQMQSEYGSKYLSDDLFLDDYQSGSWLPLGPGNTYYILKTKKVSDYYYKTDAFVLSYGTRSVMMDDGSYQMVDKDVLILKRYGEYQGFCKYFETLIYLDGHNDDITASMAMLKTADSLFSLCLGGLGVGGKVICTSKDVYLFVKNFDYQDAQSYLDIIDNYNIDVINKSYEVVFKGNVPVGSILGWTRKMGDLYIENQKAKKENLDPYGTKDLSLDYFRGLIRDAGFPDSVADTGLKDTVNKIYKLRK